MIKIATTTQKIIFGILTILISTGVIYVQFFKEAQIRVDEDKAVFYKYVSGWKIAGIENLRLFNGTTIVNRVTSRIEVWNITQGNKYIIYRKTPYISGTIIVSKYIFDSTATEIERFPSEEYHTVTNGKGLHFRYSLDQLKDTGPKRKLTNETSIMFGYNLKVDFPSGYSWAWVGYPYGSDSFSVQYKITDANAIYDIRMYDPAITCTFDGYGNNTKYEYGTTLKNMTCTGFSNLTMVVGDGLDTNFTIFSGSNYSYKFSTLRQNKFSDGTTSKVTPLYYYTNKTEEDYMYHPSYYNAILKDSTVKTSSGTFNPGIAVAGCYDNSSYYISPEGSYCSYSTVGGAYITYNFSSVLNISSVGLSMYLDDDNYGNAIVEVNCSPTGLADDWIVLLSNYSRTNRANISVSGLSQNCKALRYFAWNCSAENWCIVWEEMAMAVYPTLNNTIPPSTTISLDNRTDITQASFSIAGISEQSYYPYNVVVVVSNQSFYFKGHIYGNWLYNNKLEYSGKEYTSYNLSFTTSEKKIINMNISAGGIVEDANPFSNITFSLRGFDIDNSNAFVYIEYFNDTNTTSNHVSQTETTASSPMGIFDDIENNATTAGLWEQEYDCTISPSCFYNITHDYDDDYYHVYLSGVYGFTQTLTSSSFFLNNYTSLRINVSLITGGGHPSGFCPYSAAAWITQYIAVTDGTSSITLVGNSVSIPRYSSASSEFGGEIVVINQINTDNWLIYKNSVYSSTVGLSSLDKNQPWEIKLYQTMDYQHSDSCGNLVGMVANAKIRKLEFGGISLNKNNENFTSNQTFRSTVLFTAPTPISAAVLDAIEYIPQGTSINYFISNDNKTWTTIDKGVRKAFVSEGNNLTVLINLTTENILISPQVYRYDIAIIPGSPSDIVVDVGDDGVSDYTVNGELNSSNSPINLSVNSNPLHNYIMVYCSYSTTGCLVPISIKVNSTGGIVEISNLNISQNLSDMRINSSVIENLNSVNISATVALGAVNISKLKFDFLGNKNITFSLYDGTVLNAAYNILVRYSKFNISLPEGIDWYDVFAKTNNDKNLTPYGQTNTTPIFSIQNQAYEDYIDVYVWANESINSSVNITFNVNNSRLGGYVLNTTPQRLCFNVSLDSNCSVWNWIDLYNYTGRFYLPYYTFSAICADCVLTTDYHLTNLVVE